MCIADVSVGGDEEGTFLHQVKEVVKAMVKPPFLLSYTMFQLQDSLLKVRTTGPVCLQSRGVLIKLPVSLDFYQWIFILYKCLVGVLSLSILSHKQNREKLEKTTTIYAKKKSQKQCRFLVCFICN